MLGVRAFQFELGLDMHIEIQNVPENMTVSLFLLKPEHVTEAYVSWLNTSNINQYLESRFTNHTIKTTQAFVEKTLASPDNVFFGIKSHLLDRHVGNIKIGPIDHTHGTADIGILIGDQAAWGKGVATTAISLITEIARTQLELRKLTAGSYRSNVRSQRAFKKAGFVVEGIRPAQFLLNGKPEDLVLMGRLLR
jgi:ribosomal-protein-alanine N-acetyltransferase